MPTLAAPWYVQEIPGQIIYQTNFSDPPGPNGFTPLMDSGNSPRPGIVLVCFPAFQGTYALQLVTGPVGNAVKDGSCGAWLRLSRLFDTTKTYGWDCWYAVGNSDTTNAPQQVQFGFDTQSRDGTKRWLPQWRNQIINAGTGLAQNQILVLNDAGAYVLATDKATGVNLGPPYIYNQNKLNLLYQGGRWNATTGYQTATLWDQTIDISNQSFGSAATATATNFAGGFNFGATLTNRGGSHLSSAWLVIGQIRIWME